jgi:hypothetical protein
MCTVETHFSHIYWALRGIVSDDAGHGNYEEFVALVALVPLVPLVPFIAVVAVPMQEARQEAKHEAVQVCLTFFALEEIGFARAGPVGPVVPSAAKPTVFLRRADAGMITLFVKS